MKASVDATAPVLRFIFRSSLFLVDFFIALCIKLYLGLLLFTSFSPFTSQKIVYILDYSRRVSPQDYGLGRRELHCYISEKVRT